MKENRLIKIVSTGFVLAHFILIIIMVMFYQMGNYSSLTFKVALLIISPLFISYSSSILTNKTFRRKLNMDKGVVVDKLLVFISLFVPVVFFSLLYFIVIRQSRNAVDLEMFVTSLGIVESLFAVFIGRMISNILNLEII